MIKMGRMIPVLALCSLYAVLLCACNNTSLSAQTLPPGDPTRGAVLFKESISGAPACTTCHSVDGSGLIGPTMRGYGAIAGTRIGNTSAADYTYQSIFQPATHIVDGYTNQMYGQYANVLTLAQTADLIAYLLSL